MNMEQLPKAFKLLRDFKLGRLPPGSDISEEHMNLLRILSNELLPDEEFSIASLSELIPKLARTDTMWNQRTQGLADEFYELKKNGKLEASEARRNQFIAECPSNWYRGIAQSL